MNYQDKIKELTKMLPGLLSNKPGETQPNEITFYAVKSETPQIILKFYTQSDYYDQGCGPVLMAYELQQKGEANYNVSQKVRVSDLSPPYLD